MTASSRFNSQTPRFYSKELASEAVSRLEKILKSPFSDYASIESFRQAFHAYQTNQGKKHLKGYKDLVAATLGADNIKDIESLALLVDDDLSWDKVLHRRDQHIVQLHDFIVQNAPVVGFSVPENLFAQCKLIVELVQPLTVAWDKYPETYLHLLKAKAEGRLPDEFRAVYQALISGEAPRQVTVFKAMALLELADEKSLTPQLWHSVAWQMMREELGPVATRWVNSKEPVLNWRGITLLHQLWHKGIVYAGLQLAQVFFHLASEQRINKPRALDIIEDTYLQYCKMRENGPVFFSPGSASEIELYCAFNMIVSDAIKTSGDPEEVNRLTRNLLGVLLEAAEKRFPSFAACVLCIITPDFPPLHDCAEENEIFFALRRHIAAFPDAEDYCRTLAGTEQIKHLQHRLR